jgi:hypothetical protein
MAIPDDGPTTPGGEWVYEGKDLKADPSSMRGYGKNVATIGQNLQGDMMGGVTSVNGGGQDTAISTGGFPEGQHAEELATRNGMELLNFIQDALQSTQAISAVAHICADLYEGSDGANAVKLAGVEWGFAMTDNRPPGVPPWLNKADTLDEMRSEADEKLGDPQKAGDEKLISSHSIGNTTFFSYQSADGTTRNVVRTGDRFTETGYNKDGTVIYKTEGNSKTATSTQYQDGKAVGTTTRLVTEQKQGDVTTRRAVTVQRPAEGQATRSTETTVTRGYSDGTETRSYYTDTQQEKEDGSWGEKERSGEREVGVQPKKITPEDVAEQNRKMLERTRNQVQGM